MEIIGFGASTEVGRSCFLLRDKDRSIVLDAGLKIRPKEPTLAPNGIEKHAKDLDAIILSHAHVDHSGYIPALYKHGYEGLTYMTPPTKDISYVLWKDHLKIEGERHWRGDDLEETMNKISEHKYHQKFKIADGIYATFYDAGHILGSAITLIDWDGQLIVYTGDINDQKTPLFDGFEIPGNEPIDVLITEDTHGDQGVPPRDRVEKEFSHDVSEVLNKGNKVLAPAFAVGRSQELLFILGEILTEETPVYIDGMIKKMNLITNYYLHRDWVSDRVFAYIKKYGIFNPFDRENFLEITKENVNNTYDFRYQLANDKGPAVILSTSGMMEGGPIHTHLEVHGGNPHNLLAITGYQVEGTLGRSILDGNRDIIVNEMYNPTPIHLNLKVKSYRFSGHATAQGIKDLVIGTRPKHVFLVHSDEQNITKGKHFLTNGVVPKILKRKKKVVIKS